MNADEIKVICAWCKKHLRGDVKAVKISHGICPNCDKKQIAEINRHGEANAETILNRMGGKQ